MFIIVPVFLVVLWIIFVCTSKIHALFNQLNKHAEFASMPHTPVNSSTPKRPNPNSFEYKINHVTDSILNDEQETGERPPGHLLGRRRSSGIRSQSIAIAGAANGRRGLVSEEELDDEFDLERLYSAGSLKSNGTYMSAVSVSSGRCTKAACVWVLRRRPTGLLFCFFQERMLEKLNSRES